MKDPWKACFLAQGGLQWATLKQDAAYEPECSHVEHFLEISYLNSLVHVSPVTVPVHCRLWNAEEGGAQSVEVGVRRVECGV